MFICDYIEAFNALYTLLKNDCCIYSAQPYLDGKTIIFSTSIPDTYYIYNIEDKSIREYKYDASLYDKN